MSDPITAPPAAPSRSTPSTFSTLADAFIAWFAGFVTQLNAVVLAMNWNSLTSTSTTSDTIALGSTSLTVGISKSYLPGHTVKIARTSSPSNWMHGDVTSYNAGTGALVVNVLDILGSGTFTDWTITFSAPNAVAKNIAVGSDADGDMYYRASGVLTRLAKGAANLKLFMNAAGTAPEWATGIKGLSLARDMNAATGDVAYTAVGFKPSYLLVMATVGTTANIFCSGKSQIGSNTCIYLWPYTTPRWEANSNFIQIITDSAGANEQHAIVKSFDSDGFTLTWTKVGSPTDTITFIVSAFR